MVFNTIILKRIFLVALTSNLTFSSFISKQLRPRLLYYFCNLIYCFFFSDILLDSLTVRAFLLTLDSSLSKLLEMVDHSRIIIFV